MGKPDNERWNQSQCQVAILPNNYHQRRCYNHQNPHHQNRNPGKGPSSPPRLSPQLLYSHHYSQKNTDYLGEPLETPSAMNITGQRTRPMERIKRRCLKSQSLSQITPYSNQARQTSFQLMGKGGVIKIEGSWHFVIYISVIIFRRIVKCWLLLPLLCISLSFYKL